MKYIRRLMIWTLFAALCAALPPSVVFAQSDWQALYLAQINALRKEQNLPKRVIWLADILPGGAPELIDLGVNAANRAHLTVYTMEGGRVTPCTGLSNFTVEGVKSANVQLRVSRNGEACLTLNLSASVKGSAYAHCLAFAAGNEASALKSVYQSVKVTKGGRLVKASVDGKSVTAAAYKAAANGFLNSYAKKGANLALKSLGRGNSATLVKTKFAQLAKSYAAFSNVKKITLSKSAAALATGESLALKASVSPASAFLDALSWSSSDPSVATVEDGKVMGVGAGRCTISARSASGKSESCAVTVTGDAATALSLSATSATLVKGERVTLTPSGGNGSYAWSSSQPKVATVTQSGLVTALSAGQAVISVKSGAKTVKCKVVVNSRKAVIVDISQHNYSEKMNWERIADNVDLLILRCGVTRTKTAPIGIGIDARFAFYANKCKSYGIPYGAYYYGKVNTPEEARKEARMTWKTASPYNPLFYVYDVEEAKHMSRAVVEAYIDELKSLGAKKTGLYVAHHLYAGLKLDPSIVDFMWIPNYGKNNGTVNSTPSYKCDIHQYSSNGRVPGFPGVVDVNRLMGTKTLNWFLS